MYTLHFQMQEKSPPWEIDLWCQLIGLLYASLAELNEQLPPNAQLALSPETSLLPGTGGLDSLGVVNLMAAIEEKIEGKYGITVSLGEVDRVGAGGCGRSVAKRRCPGSVFDRAPECVQRRRQVAV
jgi:acyl carrier protein